MKNDQFIVDGKLIMHGGQSRDSTDLPSLSDYAKAGWDRIIITDVDASRRAVYEEQAAAYNVELRQGFTILAEENQEDNQEDSRRLILFPRDEEAERLFAAWYADYPKSGLFGELALYLQKDKSLDFAPMYTTVPMEIIALYREHFYIIDYRRYEEDTWPTTFSVPDIYDDILTENNSGTQTMLDAEKLFLEVPEVSVISSLRNHTFPMQP